MRVRPGRLLGAERRSSSFTLAMPKSSSLTTISPPSRRGEEEVGRLDVAVDDARLVRLAEPDARLRGDAQREVRRERAEALEERR